MQLTSSDFRDNVHKFKNSAHKFRQYRTLLTSSDNNTEHYSQVQKFRNSQVQTMQLTNSEIHKFTEHYSQSDQ
jgi:hypothetical protein